jgi:hypothetical protein
MARKLKAVVKSEPLKLDLGCGSMKLEGWHGVDIKKFPGVDTVCDLMKQWPWKDGTVSEINMSHTMEHFTGKERVFIMNEMCRVLQKGATAKITTPSWASNRAYGDFTHMWPPVSEMAYSYVNKKWREEQAPHTDIAWNPEGYTCDFDVVVGWYGIHPELVGRSEEAKQWWLTFGKESAFDLQATLTKR